MMIISHRGNDNHNYKENTIEAVVFSLNRDYVDGVEVDIMFTKDKEIVLNHDYIYNNRYIKMQEDLQCTINRNLFYITNSFISNRNKNAIS